LVLFFKKEPLALPYLVPYPPRGYVKRMRVLLTCLLLAVPAAALADGPAALGPNGGKYGDWTAATFGSGADKICYAFTTASASKPEIKSRGPVLLTVTERAADRDEVTIGAGYTYPKDAAPALSIGTTTINFYTQGGTAFTTDGGEAVAAFRAGDSAEAVGPGPHGHPVHDSFSLTGFNGAFHAISAACP